MLLFFKKEALSFFLLSHSALACTQTHIGDLPITLFQDKLIVPVQIDTQTVYLAIDTGADTTVLSTAAARALNIPHDFDHTMSMVGVSGADSHLYTGQVQQMQVAGLHFDGWHFPIADLTMRLADGSPIGGLLGGDILTRFDLDLDIEGRTVGLWRIVGCSTVSPPWGGASAVPLQRGPNNHISIGMRVDGAPVTAVLDTGAGGFVLNERDAARAGADAESLEAGPRIWGRGVDDRIWVGHMHVFQDVRIGDARYGEVRTEVVPRARLQTYDGLAGLRFLRQRRVWISYATNTLFVQTAPGPGR